MRRIPENLSCGATDIALSKLEPHPSGITFFHNFDFWDKNDHELLFALITAIVSLDRKNQRSAYFALKQAGVLQTMQTVLEDRPAHAFAPDFVDLWNLYSFIRTNRPQQILEFGSGLSTLVMAHALYRNGGGHLYSVEPIEKWETETRKMLPSELAPYCDVHYSPAMGCKVTGVKTARFARVPDITPDLVYLDGAPKGATFEGAEEIYFLEGRLSPGAVVIIDGRMRALWVFLDGRLKREWDVWTQTVAVDYPAPLGRCCPCGLDQFSNSMCVLVK